MGIEQKILVRARSLCAVVASAMCMMVALSACGQKGNLYMPNDPEFQQRAKLPDIVRRQLPGTSATPASSPAAAPTATPPATAASAAMGR
jgi:predicted small lipoprotein YifL